MKYDLRFSFKLRGKFPVDAEAKIKEWLKELRKILEKGIKEEEIQEISQVKKWEIIPISNNEDEFDLTVTSGRVLPPHHALLRMRKFFSEKFGKEYRLGISGVEIKSYKIEVDIPNRPAKEFTLPFVKSIKFSENTAKLILDKDIPIDFIEKGTIDRIVKLVKNKILEEIIRGKDEHHMVIWETEQKKPIVNENPTDLMITDGWIQRTSYRNQWIFGPAISALTEALKQIMIDEIYNPLGFKNMIFPKLVPWEVWKRSGHLSGIYQGGFEPYFICTPKTADPEYWEEIADYFRITLEVEPEKIMEKLRPPIGGLSFAQCPPFWSYLQGKTIADDSFPIFVYDWSGPTYRYESGAAHGFERVDELHRIETLYIGFPEQIKKVAQDLRVLFRKVIGNILDLEFREAWVTPWWSSQEGKGEAEEEKDIAELPIFNQIGTIDMEIYTPYRGTRQESNWLETQNISILGNKYAKGFTVKSQSGNELWSGCGGGSFERYISAFVAQKGTNPEFWPKKLLKYIDKLPTGPKFL
ncbi:MAG TPA: serine--tRNA ligase [candidate division Zixibacteria bacterium]|nr:serine--tRNA ligase [candidate division Zixibacteria bacterium]